MSSPTLAAQAEAAPRPEPSLKSKAVRGSLWTFGAFGAQRALSTGRFVALRWFLVPEVFGLMTLVHQVLTGLAMFSDFGIQPAVIQNERGDERRFLDTAWTLQVARGLLLALVAVGAAWPVARYYEADALVWLLMAMAAVPLLEGFTSTSLMTLQRHLEIKTLRLFELGISTVGVVVMVVLAWWTRSVWALVIGALATSSLKVGFSYTLTSRSGRRFAWDRSAVHELVHFGKWIFLATAVGFVSSSADQLILPKVVSLAALGIYGTATKLTDMVTGVVTSQTHNVLFPAFCQVGRESTARLRSVYYRVRLRVDALFIPAVGGLFVVSQWLIELIVPPEYWLAGWMLRFLCIRTAMSVALVPCETCLFSMGHTRYGLYRNTGRAVWVLLAVPLGYTLYGLEGFLWAVALSEVPVLLVLWPAFRRFGMLDLRRELVAPGLFGLGMLAGYGFLAVAPQISREMDAVRFHEYGGPEVLVVERVPVPRPGPGQVLVQVHAAGVNPVDWKVRQGGLRGTGPDLPQVPGYDVAGVVATYGEGVERLQVGDEVWGYLSLQRGGAYAQYVIAEESELALKPEELSFVEAAAMPLAALTAWQALFDNADLQAGQTVLVHAGAGGVGHFAVQLAHARGAKVIATASERNHEFLRELGADVVIDYRTQRFEEVAGEVDVVLDSIGGDTQQRSLQVLRPGGFLVSIVGGPDAAALEQRGLRGAGMLVQPSAAQLDELSALVVAGELRPVVSHVFPLAEARKAHEQSETGHTRGKIVLEVVEQEQEEEG
jgi:NADPH:quinone reductase-like Zn-dependent oxidoreductase/O-antigen/teichoic acid export membrane protein